eukprot:8165255-Ditylum_brightwellii.AAC.1
MPAYPFYQGQDANSINTLLSAVEPQDQKIYNHIQISLEIQQLHDTTFTKEKAEDVNMILDGKTLVDKKTLQKLTKTEAINQSKTLQKELNILKKKVDTSNVKRIKTSSDTTRIQLKQKKDGIRKKGNKEKANASSKNSANTRKTLPTRKTRSHQQRKRKMGQCIKADCVHNG